MKTTAQPDCNSAIGQHLLKYIECAKNYEDTKFLILTTARSQFQLRLLEATYIKIRQPSLCEQKNLYSLCNYLNYCRIQTCAMLRSLQDFASTHVTQQTTTQSCFARNICGTLTLRINARGFFTTSLSRLSLKSVTRKASGIALLKFKYLCFCIAKSCIGSLELFV